MWQHALKLLRLAERWMIVGYSCVPEDLAVRSLFLRAQHSREREGAAGVPAVQPSPVAAAVRLRRRSSRNHVVMAAAQLPGAPNRRRGSRWLK